MITQKTTTKVIFYAILGAVAVLAVIPFLWGMSTSLKVESQIFSRTPQIIPDPVTLENFQRAAGFGIFPALFRSLKVSVFTVTITLLASALAAYSVSRIRWRFSQVVFLLLLVPQMLPGLINLVPLFIMMSRLGLVNTHLALILVLCAANIPIVTWILRGFFDTIPKAIEESALIEGCTRLKTLFVIILPSSRAGLAAGAIYAFLTSWNNYVEASALLTQREKFTIPLVLFSFIQDYLVDWGGLMAAAWFAALPILVLFFLLQKQFIYGLAGGVKY